MGAIEADRGQSETALLRAELVRIWSVLECRGVFMPDRTPRRSRVSGMPWLVSCM